MIGINDTGSSSVIVLQICVNQLNLKENRRIRHTLVISNDTSIKEIKIFEVIKIDVGKSSAVPLLLVSDGLYYNVLLEVN